ncbi:MAG TPA: hypothetical protein VMB34_21445 [Acetobacteraceae bacterium]|nr:hypothetical protein [Acetobacteraceae bacterium]
MNDPIKPPSASGGEAQPTVAPSLQPQCRVCGSRDTINAHLFPRALGHDLRGDQKNLFVGSASAPGRLIVQAGLSDTGILCAVHDRALGDYDRYGTEFCRSFLTRSQHAIPNMWEVYGVDSSKLVKFWLAILWRFSISNLLQTTNIKLGAYEDRIRDILFYEADCSVEPAITMLLYCSQIIPSENVCFVPYPTAFPGNPVRLEAYGVAVSGFHAFVKLDTQPLASELHQVTINGKRNIVGGYLRLEETEQFQKMRAMARNMSLKHEFQQG